MVAMAMAVSTCVSMGSYNSGAMGGRGGTGQCIMQSWVMVVVSVKAGRISSNSARWDAMAGEAGGRGAGGCW